MNIEPTRHCFDDALEYVNKRVLADPSLAQRDTLILVHGIALAPAGESEGERFAHAWVEEVAMSPGGPRWQCWLSGLVDGQLIYYAVPRDNFYDVMRIQKSTRYTIREACLENLRTFNFGPWVPEYRALCGGHKTFGGVPAEIDPLARNLEDWGKG